MDNKNIFSYENKTNNKLKPFIIAFGVFVVILAVFSIVLFMYSLDFDINNLVETTTENVETTTKEPVQVYSVENLSGTSDVMFLITDEQNVVQSVFCTLVDFDNKSFKVKQVDGDAVYLYGDKYMTINNIYSENGETVEAIENIVIECNNAVFDYNYNNYINRIVFDCIYIRFRIIIYQFFCLKPEKLIIFALSKLQIIHFRL